MVGRLGANRCILPVCYSTSCWGSTGRAPVLEVSTILMREWSEVEIALPGLTYGYASVCRHEYG